ncbi:hypothetical protein HGM15179_019644 [Zosterops borbonicus]|uniref:Uncharacterized protein n=1 Tax=Zosterops borbonicus TaxID=364589 RepID=A0A8K1FYM1_9PASS|nr:hypothetical protein HGM15179_019644 [Zosterops borbonicus]
MLSPWATLAVPAVPVAAQLWALGIRNKSGRVIWWIFIKRCLKESLSHCPGVLHQSRGRDQQAQTDVSLVESLLLAVFSSGSLKTVWRDSDRPHGAVPPVSPYQEEGEGFDGAVDAGKQETSLGRQNGVAELLQEIPEAEGENEGEREEDNNVEPFELALL